jgi:hypothetical protein
MFGVRLRLHPSDMVFKNQELRIRDTLIRKNIFKDEITEIFF